MKLGKKIALAVLVAGTSLPALATNGYFSHGYGMKAKGMGGAATAMASDTFGGANNPASMVWVGNRWDVGLDWFSPKRSAERTGSSGFGAGMDGSVTSGSNNFWIPEFGYNRMLSTDMSLGVTVYGNGGMNTDYSGGQIAAGTACNNFHPNGAAGAPFNLLCGSKRLGIDMMQLVIAPTFAVKASENHSFGVSPLIGYQRFKAEGLHGFANYTPSVASWPTNYLTNRGYDSSHGFGLRLGWMGKLSDRVTLGAAYATKMKMSKFDKYKELFAEQGDFDMPANFNLGIAFKATSDLTIAADYQRIDYDGVKSVSNSSRTPLDAPPNGGIANSLGCDDCRGFGWKSINVFKLGVEYKYNPNLTLRAGWNHGDNPIRSRDVTFNFIAPGVIKDHLTLGFTYNVSKDSELTMSYMHGFSNSVSGASLFNAWLGDNAQEKIKMHQNSLGIAYSVKFQ